MIENNLDFYLEDITESTRNTNRIKELRGIKNNQIFHVRQNSTQKFYQYRLDKIGQFKGYLRCIDYKCNSRLEVIFGLEMTTVKVGKSFQFHELVSEKMLRNPDNYQGLNHKCTKKCTAKCTTVHKCKGFKCNMVHFRNHRAMTRQAREFDRLSETKQKIGLFLTV